MTGFGPLQGLRILDLTQALAGPFCTQVLADLGADVVKLEPPQTGDMARLSGPFHPSDKEMMDSGYFHSINRNKRSIVLDLKNEEGKKIFKSLLPSFDVLVENFRAGVMDSLGLSYETLARECPKLVYAAIRGFGDPRGGASPYVNWPAYDVVAQAMGGIIGITGTDTEHRTKVGSGVGDTVPALYLAVGILAAVLHARAKGHGQFVDVAMVDAVLGVCERIVHQRSFGKVNAVPEGNHHPFIAPFGVFRAKDGAVSIACPSDEFFQALCVGLGAAELATDPAFRKREGRRANRAALIQAVEKLTIVYTKAELQERLGGRIPFGPVYSMNEIALDTHFAARGMLAEIECSTIPERVQIAGVPIKLSKTPGKVVRRGPRQGEHTDEVLKEAGFSTGEIAAWRRAGVLK
jgi:crotonobetainyl-CoA:carnitine CoA-transferase CaiB-like acyl-CoA transferase